MSIGSSSRVGSFLTPTSNDPVYGKRGRFIIWIGLDGQILGHTVVKDGGDLHETIEHYRKSKGWDPETNCEASAVSVDELADQLDLPCNMEPMAVLEQYIRLATGANELEAEAA